MSKPKPKTTKARAMEINLWCQQHKEEALRKFREWQKKRLEWEKNVHKI